MVEVGGGDGVDGSCGGGDRGAGRTRRENTVPRAEHGGGGREKRGRKRTSVERGRGKRGEKAAAVGRGEFTSPISPVPLIHLLT